MIRNRLIIPAAILLTLSLTACFRNLPTQPAENLAKTFAAQTLQANLTLVPGVTVSPAVVTPVPGKTLLPSSTPIATNTPVPSIPTNTAVPIPCDAAQFVGDVSVPDGSIFAQGVRFTKTWRLKNVGACTWTTGYALVFTSGNAMNAPASQVLAGSVQPGQTIDVSVELTAPNSPGSYRGDFKLRNASGALFGLGSNQDKTFYVDIRVAGPVSADSDFNMVENACLAEWSSGAGVLPCPGKDGDGRGFVIRVDKPRLENGATENEPALITYPQSVNDGLIRGKFTPVPIKAGDTFRAVVGCENDAKSCNVQFKLDYQVDNGAVQNLGTWGEIYDGNVNSVVVDLSALAGKNVTFYLTVLGNGSTTGDRAQWLMPRIYRLRPTATPTSTSVPPTPTPTTAP